MEKRFFELENKLTDKIHTSYKDAVNSATCKITNILTIFGIILTLLWLWLWIYIGKKYTAIEKINENVVSITQKYENMEIIDKVMQLQEDIEKNILTWTNSPIWNITPNFIWQIYIDIDWRESDWWPIIYISSNLSKDWRYGFYAENSLFNRME